MPKVRIAVGIMLLGAALLGAGAVSAHKGATGVVKKRMVLMATVGKSARTISAMFMGGAPYNAARVRRAARRIADHGAGKMTQLFPKDSIKGPSTAVPEIWQEWELFSAYAADMRKFAIALSRAAANRRSARADNAPLNGPGGFLGGEREPVSDARRLARMPPEAAFGRLMQTCGACHTRFRRQR